jgi:hypothetical protein
MAFFHLAAMPPRIRYPTTGFRVPENTPNGQIIPSAKHRSPLCPAACSPPTTRLSCSITAKRVRMALSYLVERCCTFGATSLACECRKDTSNGQILGRTQRHSPSVQLPVHHRSTHLSCSITAKRVRMALTYLVKRYLTFGTTSLACGCRTKHIQRTKSLQAKCLSPLCPAAYSPHHHRRWCSLDLKQVRMALTYLVER